MKKIILFIAAVWVSILLMLDAPIAEVIVNAIMFTICLYCFTDRHFREPKIYPKIIGVLYYLAILSSLIFSMEFESINQSIGYNLVLTIEFIIVQRNIIKTYYESDETRFGYVVLTLVFAVLFIFVTMFGYDYSGNELALYFICYCSIFFFMVMSLGIGRYFIKKRVLIKGYYSYWMIGLSAIICGLVDLLLLIKYLDDAINIIPFILIHALILCLCGIFSFIGFIQNKNRFKKNVTSKRIKFKLCPICKNPNELAVRECCRCRIDLNHIQPICPNCGENIHLIYDNRCPHCHFILSEYLNQKIFDKNNSLINVVSSEDKTLYKLCVSEGMFVTNYTKILKPKKATKFFDNILGIDAFENINIYGKSFSDESTDEDLQGYIHIYEEKGNYAWCIYSPELISNTHKDYTKKIEKEELEKKRREKQIEIERQLAEENRIRKEKEEQELKQKQAEEAILLKQEHARKISEQTGIILD